MSDSGETRGPMLKRRRCVCPVAAARERSAWLLLLCLPTELHIFASSGAASDCADCNCQAWPRQLADRWPTAKASERAGLAYGSARQ